MKFNSIQELIEIINEHCAGDISQYDISVSVKKIEETIVESAPPVLTEDVDVTIRSLGGDPKVVAKKDSTLTENILYVKSVESIPFSCGTGKVELLDRTIFTNICENDGTGANITLNISEANGEVVPVTFKLVEGTPPDKYIMLLKQKSD